MGRHQSSSRSILPTNGRKFGLEWPSPSADGDERNRVEPLPSSGSSPARATRHHHERHRAFLERVDFGDSTGSNESYG
ncbi:hypothetical protein CYV19_06175 [Natronobacterium gregoryi SP2]|uniref:Uncharacterized protein n=1 Tax=Natronobacterium gregoryi (strain ATCC 43098 / DSM 3393 / CCM 3738 / CIP 104747 / IAM 13177 / JCM 8860 / NBRC 102187 / NCIMB 2189 / SP2) TaxID=797304 RepID=L9YJ63_NATGS|nr:hypothetical protein C490_02276 [Natronobacterium gregoryi SP2]PLK21018.1 hypothetical protein CYV19_06175 [Natronobacterium gregoryi SP2]